MKARTILTSLAVFLLGVGVSLAADANLGTWKLNEAKSKIPADGTKNTTVVYAMAGDMVKVTVDGTTGDGKPAHSEWTGKYDGKDYPATGAADHDSRWYKQVDDKTIDFGAKKAGKSIGTGKVVLSADGKSRTVTSTFPGADGKPVTSTSVYDKQ
jgi:VCBS repeat-containing protein